VSWKSTGYLGLKQSVGWSTIRSCSSAFYLLQIYGSIPILQEPIMKLIEKLRVVLRMKYMQQSRRI
jgi:hypothetical protein